MRRSSLSRPALTALLLAAALVAGCAQQPNLNPLNRGPAPPPVASQPQQPVTPPVIQQENVPPATPAPVEPPIVLRPPVSADGKVRVGVIVPLSGQAAGVGRALLDAANLALFDEIGRAHV